MIKYIITSSRSQVKNWIKSMVCPLNNWALISMYGESGSNEEPLLNDTNKLVFKKLNCKRALSIQVEDLTDKTPIKELEEKFPGRTFHLFNENHAKAILDFVTKVDNENVSTLIVQCAAGVSRSGAVGLWACRFLGMDEVSFRNRNMNIMPNFYMLSVLNRFCHMDTKYINKWMPKGVDPRLIFT